MVSSDLAGVLALAPGIMDLGRSHSALYELAGRLVRLVT
jgi:hypothetical protein